MEKGVSRDEETETRESEEKRTTKLWVGGCFTSTSLRYFSVWRQIPIFQACSGEPWPLPLHSSKPEKKVIREPQRGKASPPLASDLSFSSFVLSPLMNTSLLWWTGRLERGGAGAGLLTGRLDWRRRQERKKRRMTSSPYHHLSSTQVCS